MSLHIITSYKKTNFNRDKEILSALERNLANVYVSNITLLLEGDLLIEHPKLKIIKILMRPSFYDLISYSDDNCINILINCDISFTSDIKRIFHILNHRRKVGFITRRLNLDFLGKRIIFKHNTGNSQDAWAILGKIKESKLMEELRKVEIGVPGNDNAMVYLFRQYEYEVLNPSYAITLLHHHKSQKRSYTDLDRLNLNYDYVKPGIALNNNLFEYITFFINLIYYRKWFR